MEVQIIIKGLQMKWERATAVSKVGSPERRMGISSMEARPTTSSPGVIPSENMIQEISAKREDVYKRQPLG